MSDTRVLRADATRNRKQLLEVATRVFIAAGGAEPSMRAIAREAGVGIATLCRHFPTRESLVDAVYRDQVARLTDGARELLAELPRPLHCGAGWTCSGEWIATKSGMLDTLLVMMSPRNGCGCSPLSPTASHPASARPATCDRHTPS